MNQFARLNVSYLNEIRFESQDVGVVECESLRRSFPLNLPVLSRSPPVAIDKEGEVGVVEEELAVQTLYVDRFDILLSCDKVQGSVSLV